MQQPEFTTTQQSTSMLPTQQASQFEIPSTTSKSVFRNDAAQTPMALSSPPQNQPLAFGQVQYSPEERGFLQEALNDKLGDQYITSRPGPGGKPVHYISTATAISLANETFGFNGWSSSIVEITFDYQDQAQNGRYSVGLSAIVRVTLKDGTFHEDVGYGTADNIKDRGQAIENAKKKAVSDALKRALRNFGNALGLSVYDKDHLNALSKSKARSKFANGPQKEVGHNSRPQNPHFVSAQQSLTPNVVEEQQPVQQNGGTPHMTPAFPTQTTPPLRGPSPMPQQAAYSNTIPLAPQQQNTARGPPFQRSTTPQAQLPPQRSPTSSGPPPQQNAGMNRSTPPQQSTPPNGIPQQQNTGMNRSSPQNVTLPQQRYTPANVGHLPPQQQAPPRQLPPQQTGVKRANEFGNQSFQQNKKMRQS